MWMKSGFHRCNAFGLAPRFPCVLTLRFFPSKMDCALVSSLFCPPSSPAYSTQQLGSHLDVRETERKKSTSHHTNSFLVLRFPPRTRFLLHRKHLPRSFSDEEVRVVRPFLLAVFSLPCFLRKTRNGGLRGMFYHPRGAPARSAGAGEAQKPALVSPTIVGECREKTCCCVVRCRGGG